MVTITLKDGKTLSFLQAISILEVAKSISPSLAKRAIAAEVDGKVVDLSYVVNANVKLAILSAEDSKGLEVIRHSTAHLLAQAVKQLFKEAQVAIGPVIEDGFYYDFANVRPFTPEDLVKIEAKMHELAKLNQKVERRVVARKDAINFFTAKGEHFKAKIIEDIPEGSEISLYKQGDFEDLCRGPHVPSTGCLKTFKLLRVAGAYWRGDSNNPMLQRIYGTAFAKAEDLELYLHRLEEAEKRDHRKLGKALDLFHFQDLAPGMVFWHAKGWTIYRLLEEYMRNRLREDEYQEIKTPQLVDKILWEKSGHWQNFRESMFVTETENRQFAIKPMSCPCHVQVFNTRLRSYRDLPMRLAEFGSCHRCEPSGALHGLLRVRHFVQDDGHIFCTEDQIQSEVIKLLNLVEVTYRDFGFLHIHYRLALRPEKRVGSDEVWDKAETALRNALASKGIKWEDAPNEGAFYGPKIECSLADSIGRVWQCGTFQVDFSTPERLDASYIAENGAKKTPVMLHRAILGTFERFLGILIEHYAGKLPFWLSPTQVVLMTVSEKQQDFGFKIAKLLKKSGIRTEFDLRNEKIGFKIREHTLQKVPYLLVVGDKEVAANQVSVRSREGTDLGSIPVDKLIETLLKTNIHRASLEEMLEG
ncbi:MAG: threonine--tRNA ligase [Legionellales bacterium RIFCSPHIGHO2_12_FULL_37_14]|nr:MAG: threonine--tRNA ligase [Legionellales bacterium RIFCSPHIGHO2_12_FULL_37_14]